MAASVDNGQACLCNPIQNRARGSSSMIDTSAEVYRNRSATAVRYSARISSFCVVQPLPNRWMALAAALGCSRLMWRARLARIPTTALKNKPTLDNPFANRSSTLSQGRAIENRDPDDERWSVTYLFADLAQDEQQELLGGSARLALPTEPPFDRYFFIEQTLLVAESNSRGVGVGRTGTSSCARVVGSRRRLSKSAMARLRHVSRSDSGHPATC